MTDRPSPGNGDPGTPRPDHGFQPVEPYAPPSGPAGQTLFPGGPDQRHHAAPHPGPSDADHPQPYAGAPEPGFMPPYPGPADQGYPAAPGIAAAPHFPAAPHYPAGPHGPAAQGYPAAQGHPAAQSHPAAQGHPPAQTYPAAQGHPAAQTYPAAQGHPGAQSYAGAAPAYPAAQEYPPAPPYQLPGGAYPPIPGPAYPVPPDQAFPALSYQYGYGDPYGYSPYLPARRTDGLAIAAMVVSCVAVPSMCLYGFGGLIGVVGAILGHVSRRRIRSSGAGGDGLALTGVIVGWVAAALGVLIGVALILLIVNSDEFTSTTI